MLKDTFFHEMKKRKTLDVDNYMICFKPAYIYNYDTEEERVFKNFEEVYEKGKLGDTTLKEFVDKADVNIFHKILTNDDWDIKFPTI